MLVGAAARDILIRNVVGSPPQRATRDVDIALKAMREECSLHPSLWDWADHLNQIGNEGAHPEDYDEVTSDEATALATFVAHLIRHEYEMPAELTRARALTLPTQLESENHTS